MTTTKPKGFCRDNGDHIVRGVETLSWRDSGDHIVGDVGRLWWKRFTRTILNEGAANQDLRHLN